MDLIDQLEEYGLDKKDGLDRFMDKRDLYIKMLKKLPDAISATPVLSLIESNDIENAISNSHKLKGNTGNLALIPLYNGYKDVHASLKAGDIQKAQSQMHELLSTQQKIIDCIENN